jgi:hypothetical protein
VPAKQRSPPSQHRTAALNDGFILVNHVTSVVQPKLRTETMLIRSTGGHCLTEVAGTLLLPYKHAFRAEMPCNVGLNSDMKTSPYCHPTYFMLPATEQAFTHKLTALCDLTVGLPDHAPIQFCSMM